MVKRQNAIEIIYSCSCGKKHKLILQKKLIKTILKGFKTGKPFSVEFPHEEFDQK